jgi:hypothetical protein
MFPYALAVLDEQLQVDLEHRLQQAHVRALVQADLVFPDVHDQDLTGGQRKEGALALEVLVLSSLASVCALDIHDQNVLRHARAALGPLVLAHPDALGGLAALLLGHDAELCAEEVVEQRRLARGLRAEDGYEVVVEARGDDLLDVEVGGDVIAAQRAPVSITHPNAARGGRGDLLEDLVRVDDLDAVLVGLLGGILAHAGEVRVHHGRGRGGVSNGAGAGLPVDSQVLRGHICRNAARRELHVVREE